MAIDPYGATDEPPGPMPPIVQLTPPYDSPQPVLDALGSRTARIEPGTVWLVEVAATVREPRALARWISPIRRAAPAIAVGLLLAPDLDRGVLMLALNAGVLHARAVVRAGNPLLETLRAQMTRPADLGADLLEWLAWRGTVLPPRVDAVIRAAFAPDRPPRSVGTLPGPSGTTERTLRRWFEHCGIAPPREWLALAWALRTALRIQGEPGTPLLTIAYEQGYGDHSALSRQLKRLFGVAPSVLRRTVGWEWLADRWLSGPGRGTRTRS